VLDRALYAAWLDLLIGRQPRGWGGFDAGDMLFPLFAFNDAIPEPVVEYKRLYWKTWLLPDRPTAPPDHIWDDAYIEGPMVHPQIGSLRPSREIKMVSGPGHGEMRPPAGASVEDSFDTYYARTGDWRGNKSFFRSGYNYSMSTQNFNTMAAMGALLGGTFIDAEIPIQDGRHGMEHWPLRTWSWLDGSTQESIDHYYLGHTLSAQKMVKDFAYGEFDRLIGASMVAKTMEELMSGYHPGLRRFIANSSRTNIEQLLGMQEGIYAVLHVLSPTGTLRELDKERLVANMQVVGTNFPPAKVARQSMTGPWAPEWTKGVVDKPLPFRTTAAFTQWGGRRENPVWRRTYMGNHYGIATLDLMHVNIEAMIQWRRYNRQVESATELGTMMFYSDVNDTQFSNLWLKPSARAYLQHDNKMIVVDSPYGDHHEFNNADGVSSIQQSIAIFNFEEEPSWEIFAGGRKIDQLPVDAKHGQLITIKDGVSYIGIIPLPATDLGRTAEVRLEKGGREGSLYAALMIHSYNMLRDEPAKADLDAVKRAYGGFIIEMGDATEYAGFSQFQNNLQAATLETRWEDDASTLHVKYASGDDTMETGFKTTYQRGRQSPEGFAYRRVNGEWPYLPEGIFRDTTLSQQGTTGRLEKNGAVLRSDQGVMTYLLTEPQAGAYAAWNPLPEPTRFALSVPGGISVAADGKVSILNVDLRTEPGELKIAYATREDQTGDEMAKVLLVFGMARPPAVELNARTLDTEPAKVRVGGRDAFVVPLFHDLEAERYMQDLPARANEVLQQFN